MNHPLRRYARTILFLLLATSVTACHFHGHRGWGGFGHGVPIRHCR